LINNAPDLKGPKVPQGPKSHTVPKAQVMAAAQGRQMPCRNTRNRPLKKMKIKKMKGKKDQLRIQNQKPTKRSPLYAAR
jgi:hypothetical protein